MALTPGELLAEVPHTLLVGVEFGGAGPGGGRTVPAGFEPLPPTAFRITGVLVPGPAGPILTKFTILARVRVLRHVGSRTRRQIEME